MCNQMQDPSYILFYIVHVCLASTKVLHGPIAYELFQNKGDYIELRSKFYKF